MNEKVPFKSTIDCTPCYLSRSFHCQRRAHTCPRRSPCLHQESTPIGFGPRMGIGLGCLAPRQQVARLFEWLADLQPLLSARPASTARVRISRTDGGACLHGCGTLLRERTFHAHVSAAFQPQWLREPEPLWSARTASATHERISVTVAAACRHQIWARFREVLSLATLVPPLLW